MSSYRVLHPVWHEYASSKAHALATKHMEERIHGDSPMDVYLTSYRYWYGQTYASAQNMNTWDIGIGPRDEAPAKDSWAEIIKKYVVV